MGLLRLDSSCSCRRIPVDGRCLHGARPDRTMRMRSTPIERILRAHAELPSCGAWQ